MSDSPYYIGLDLGTSATKACAFSPGGEFLGFTEADYPLEHPEPGAAVQDPMVVLEAAERALRELVEITPGRPAGVALSCPMHSLILCDESGTPVTPVYTWADVRAHAVMADFDDTARAELHRATGTPVHPMTPLVKLRWLLRERPELAEEAVFCYDLKSLLTAYWTGNAALDEQCASASGLYAARTGEWHQPALLWVTDGDFPFALPPVYPADHRLEWMKPVAERMGLAGVPLLLGGSDGVLANFGSGIFSPGEFALSVGTSGAVRTTHRRPEIDPDYGLFNYKLYGDRYVVGGATNNGGQVLEYWQELLAAHFDDVGTFVAAALDVTDDDRPQFVPYLHGERAPIWDAAATARLEGLRAHHGPAEIAAAVLHGVTDNIVAIVRQLEEAVGPATRIQVTGGITKSPEWLALLAEKCGREVVETERPRATAYGAALVAMGRLQSLPSGHD